MMISINDLIAIFGKLLDTLKILVNNKSGRFIIFLLAMQILYIFDKHISRPKAKGNLRLPSFQQIEGTKDSYIEVTSYDASGDKDTVKSAVKEHCDMVKSCLKDKKESDNNYK